MSQFYVYRCEDTADGIFSAIYKAYSDCIGNNGHRHEDNRIEPSIGSKLEYNFNLFSTYEEVPTNYELSAKVANSVRKKISGEAYDLCLHAAASDDINKANYIYQFMVLGFRVGKSVVEQLSIDYVNQMQKLRKNVWREVHHYYGFLRFTEPENGILFARIKPKNHVLPFLAEHFSDRFPSENFVIFDEIRESAVLHAANEGFTLVEGETFVLPETFSSSEDDIQTLWKAFVEHIAIKERTNYKLQRNMLPLRFRDRMTEFM